MRPGELRVRALDERRVEAVRDRTQPRRPGIGEVHEPRALDR